MQNTTVGVKSYLKVERLETRDDAVEVVVRAGAKDGSEGGLAVEVGDLADDAPVLEAVADLHGVGLGLHGARRRLHQRPVVHLVGEAHGAGEAGDVHVHNARRAPCQRLPAAVDGDDLEGVPASYQELGRAHIYTIVNNTS